MRNRFAFAATAALLGIVFSCPVRAADPAAAGDEATELTRQLVDAVRRQDDAAADELLDVDALLERTTAGINAPADFKQGFAQGFKAQAHKIMDNVIKAAGATGSGGAAGSGAGGGYHLLRIRRVNGETHIVFRALTRGTGGGLNYHDWIAAKDQQGHLRLRDLYTAGTGEMLSQTLRRGYTQAALAANPGLLDRLTGKDKEYAANLSSVLQMARDFQAGQYQQVLDEYKALPVPVQKEKNCMLMRLMAAGKLRKQSPKEYEATVNDYMRTFPNDPSVDLDCIDGLVEMKKFAEVRQSLDRLDAFTGGDPYLNFIRGNLCKVEGGPENLAKAKQLYQKAIDAEPTLAPPYWSLVTLSLEAQQYDDTAALLTQMQQKLRLKFNDLSKLPTYAGFVKSDAYKKWIANQPATKPAAAPAAKSVPGR